MQEIDQGVQVSQQLAFVPTQTEPPVGAIQKDALDLMLHFVLPLLSVR